jgi:spermidine/putrescine transport system ATP-binding protein
VRPEKADLFQAKPADSSSENFIGPGEVKDIRFTGVSNQFLVDVPNIGLVTVFEQNEGNSTVELGDQVWISWKVEHSFGLSDLPADTLDEE